MQEAAHEGASRHHDGSAVHLHPHIGLNATDAVVIREDSGDIGLHQVKVRRSLEFDLCAELVGLLVALRPRRAHTGAFLGIQEAKLNRGRIRIQAHDTAQRIDLPDNLTFCLTADCGIAGHLADSVEGLRQNQCLGAKSRRRRSCFNAAVSGTDDEHVVGCRMNEHAQFLEGQFVVCASGVIVSVRWQGDFRAQHASARVMPATVP